MNSPATPKIGDTWTIDGREVTIRQDGQHRVIVRCERPFAQTEACMELDHWLMMSDIERRTYVALVAKRTSYPHELPPRPNKQEQANREWWDIADEE